MVTKYYVPEGGLTKQGDDYRVNITYTVKSGNTYQLSGLLKKADWSEKKGLTDEAKIKVRLAEIGKEKEAYDVALPDPEAKRTTLLDDTEVVIV